MIFAGTAVSRQLFSGAYMRMNGDRARHLAAVDSQPVYVNLSWELPANVPIQAILSL